MCDSEVDWYALSNGLSTVMPDGTLVHGAEVLSMIRAEYNVLFAGGEDPINYEEWVQKIGLKFVSLEATVYGHRLVVEGTKEQVLQFSAELDFDPKVMEDI